jgi:hypothetical protein
MLSNRQRLSGVTLTELLVAMILLTAATTWIGGTLPRLARQRQLTFQTHLAREELCRQLERLTQLDADALEEAIAALQISATVASQLPQATLVASLIADDPRMGVGATAVQLQLNWTSCWGGQARSSFMETWVFPQGNTGLRP